MEEVDVVLLEGLEGGVLVAHVGAEGGDGELRAGTDELDFFGAGHGMKRDRVNEGEGEGKPRAFAQG